MRSYMGRSLRANVKSSMTHHSREQYVGPATTSSIWQPARKTGKQASDCWMLFWSMHALSCVRAVRCVCFVCRCIRALCVRMAALSMRERRCCVSALCECGCVHLLCARVCVCVCVCV